MQFVSTTNWFDHEKRELWFASWPVEATVRRIVNPRGSVSVTIWKFSFRSGDIEKVWQGDLGDALHQLCLDPSRRFLILTELGLRLEEAIPAQIAGSRTSCLGTGTGKGCCTFKNTCS